MTSIEKKFPMIHSNIRARRRRTGPVKKKIPLLRRISEKCAVWAGCETYATPVSVVEPPHPIIIAAYVNAEMTKLSIELERRRKLGE